MPKNKLFPVIPAVFFFIMILPSGCRDTCDRKMGSTFNDIRWKSFSYSSELDKYIACFSIDVIDALPADYLRTASQQPTGNSYIDSIAFPDVNQMNLYFDKSVIPFKNDIAIFQFKMTMGDRRDFTNCVHPGNPEKYEITVSFSINNVNNDVTIDNISWSEKVVKGSI